MQPLRSAELLELWERGQGCHPVDRALVVLAYACRDRSWGELCALPIGERNRLLLGLHQATFGPTLDLVTACPACSEQVEFTFLFPLQEFAATSAGALAVQTGDGRTVAMRLPDSRDLAAIAAVPDPAAARNRLVARCQLEPEADEGQLTGEAEGLLAAFSAAIEAHDPLASIAFPITCPVCARAWRATLDPVDYLWRRLTQRVRTLVREIHALATAYGWTEAEVLGLSAARRRLYLEQVGA